MAQWEKEGVAPETHLWQFYKDGLSYQGILGLSHTIPTCVDFYEGRQWPAPTDSTKNLPRPVVNIIRMICRTKKSSILSVPVKFLYKSYCSGEDVRKLNSFSEFIQKEMNQEGLDKIAIEDGIKKGSYFYHYYWDKNAISPFGRLEGGLRCEIIDPLNIFFANPGETDEQKQDWILISSLVDASSLYQICDSDSKNQISLFEKENSINSTGKTRKIVLLTRYFRKNGEVWCEKGTRHCMVNKPFKLCPDKTLYNKGEIENTKGSENSDSILDYLRIFNRSKGPGAYLYPIVCGSYEKREGSIYGISEIEGIIPNQKAINFNIAMSLLNAQQCAWGKFIALPNALKGQKITNAPGQVLIDHSGTGYGIKKMTEETLSSTPVEISQELIELTRRITGADELLSGEALKTNMSGVAIAQLQAQAEIPIEDLRSNFVEAKKKQGLVIAQFIRLYYYDKEFTRVTRDSYGKECEICDHFYSKEYENAIFDVVVEATRGTKSNITSDINLLDTCLKNGSISIETYIKAYPDGVLANKSSILEQIQAEKSNEIEVLRKELNKYKNAKTLDPVSIV